jgi:hypothetical protein
MWPNDTDDSQSMPMWMFFAASLRPGISRSRPRGAPEPTKSHRTVPPAALSGCRSRWPPRNSTPDVEHVADFLVDHRFGQAKFRIWLRIIPPARESPSNTVT